MSSTVTELTKKRPVLQQINEINRKSEEADATEPDRLRARGGELWPPQHKLTATVWRSKRRERSALFNTFPSSLIHSPPPCHHPTYVFPGAEH